MKRAYELDVYKPAEALSEMIRHNFDKWNKIECVHQLFDRAHAEGSPKTVQKHEGMKTQFPISNF